MSAGLELARSRTWERVAAGQIALYEEALTGAHRPAARPTAATRREAVARYGSPARVPGVERPFALPILRDSAALQRRAGEFVDLVTGQRRGTQS